MGLLSDLKALGLGQFEDAKIIEDPAKKKAEEVVVVKTPEELEKEAVFVRNIKCPVCDNDVSLLAMRPGKAKLEGTDSDLRPKYEKMDPIKYDAIACNSCGFAALTKYFGHLASRQVRDIKEQISPSFKGFEFKGELGLFQKNLVLCAVVISWIALVDTRFADHGERVFFEMLA